MHWGASVVYNLELDESFFGRYSMVSSLWHTDCEFELCYSLVVSLLRRLISFTCFVYNFSYVRV